MKFQKGHASLRPVVKGLEIISWECETCKVITSRTIKELYYDRKKRRFCSMKCAYIKGPRKGMITSDLTKALLSESKRGDKNPSWRGGVTPLRLQLMNTPEYKHWRKSVYERDNYTCKGCLQIGGKLEADHIVPYMNDREGLLDIDNGQTLCRKCHREKTVRELKMNWSNQYTSSKEQSL